MRITKLWAAAVGAVTVSSVFLVPIGPAGAADALINVPSEVSTIQAAIDAAPSGGSVVVAPGVYHEHIDFHGHNVEVRSSAGPASTIIDGGGTGTVVIFAQSETRATALRGFTIRNGTDTGIAMIYASPTVAGNIVTANSGSYAGGLFVYQAGPLIEGNVVRGNRSWGSGGGLYLLGNRGTEVVGNTVEDNAAPSGAGMYMRSVDQTVVLNNVIRANRGDAIANDGGGPDVVIAQNVLVDNDGSALNLAASVFTEDPVLVVNNTVAGNLAPRGSAIVSRGVYLAVNNILSSPSGSSAVWCDSAGGRLFYNDVYNGTPTPFLWCPDMTGVAGNISVDPGLAPDFSLTAGSPAIDAGHDDPLNPVVRPLDANGAGRVVDGDGDGAAVVDLGAFERPGAGLRPIAPPPASFHPVRPVRILDTRSGPGTVGKLGPGATMALQVTGTGPVPELGGVAVPATGVSAVVLNITVTEPTAVSFLTAWPAGESRPVASSLNYAGGQTVANTVVVKVGEGGKVNLFNYAGAVHVIADVAGWYGPHTAAPGAVYTPVPPARVLDTRAGTGAPPGKVGPNSTLDLQVTGAGGVPQYGVSAVVLNVTVAEPTAGSWLAVWPSADLRPLVSNLNYGPGDTVANLVVVKVSGLGRVRLYNASGSAHVIADVAGWYGEDTTTPVGAYTPLPPTRILDTRSGVGAPRAALGPGGTLSLQVTGQAGIPTGVVAAVALNVTVTEPTAVSFLTAWPGGQARPLASNLNYRAGQTVANLVVVLVGADGKVNLFNNSGTTHVIADVAGWFGS